MLYGFDYIQVSLRVVCYRFKLLDVEGLSLLLEYALGSFLYLLILSCCLDVVDFLGYDVLVECYLGMSISRDGLVCQFSWGFDMRLGECFLSKPLETKPTYNHFIYKSIQ